jgi:5-(carboxyamino)imidazole ribonucleotide synthase
MARIKTLHQDETAAGRLGRLAGTPVGILGGGQLARMLAEAALRLGLEPIVFAEAGSPAGRLGVKTMTGAPKDVEAVRRFLSSVRWCVFESEFVSTELLRIASMGVDVTLHPSLTVMGEFQDKIRQKEAFQRLRIPTAGFRVMGSNQTPSAFVDSALEAFNGSCVFKWGRMGYDGKGVFLMSDASQRAEAEAFCAAAHKQKIPLYVEEKVAFKRELAVMGCYSIDGEFKAYPLVISEQDRGVCNRVYGPATSLGISAEMEETAHTIARTLAESHALVGCFGIEFFETTDGRILVNEIAPRVHNSGHYTQDGCSTSQFENHCRAALGMPLGDVRPAPAFAMQNLLGPEGVTLAREDGTLPLVSERTHLHWYDKNEIVPRRKLGHLNGTAASPDDVPALLEELERSVQAWHASLAAAYKEKQHA